MWLATAPEIAGVTGKYFDHHCHEVKSSAYSQDRAQIEALMGRTYEYLKK